MSDTSERHTEGAADQAVAQNAEAPRRLGREAMSKASQRVLNRGGWGNPDVLLVQTESGPVVVKDFAPRAAWVRRGIGRWLLRREAAAYRRLADVASVPRLLGRVDEEALVFEYRPGTLLSRSLAGKLPAGFVAELEESLAEIHRRGVVHLDLRHRSNVLAGEDGHPVVLDFASAILCDPRRAWGRLLRASLAWVDRRAVEKWRVRLEGPGTPDPVSSR